MKREKPECFYCDKPGVVTGVRPDGVVQHVSDGVTLVCRREENWRRFLEVAGRRLELSQLRFDFL